MSNKKRKSDELPVIIIAALLVILILYLLNLYIDYLGILQAGGRW